jgi:NAD(P)-dependent dehydrogenase (short-subunit alcohol dehydrogenase family)
MSELSGKIAIITGSSGGMGRAIAEGLARKGAAVAVHYLKDAEKARAVVAGIEKAGG